jgi:hypothetical protein
MAARVISVNFHARLLNRWFGPLLTIALLNIETDRVATIGGIGLTTSPVSDEYDIAWHRKEQFVAALFSSGVNNGAAEGQ